MTTTQYKQPLVTGPARVPVPYGLFSLSGLFRDGGDRYDAAGVRWQSIDGREGVDGIGPAQTPQSDTVGIHKTFNNRSVDDFAGKFSVYGQHKVTPGAWNQVSADARAREILTSLEEREVEHILWTGENQDGGVVLSPNFTAATVIDTTTSLITGVAALEEFLAENYGSLGVIHVSRAAALRGLGVDAVFVSQGGRLFTKIGTPVVAGQGYDNGKLVCTSAMLAYRGDIYPHVGQAYGLLDKNLNDLYAIAERDYSIGWEHLALAAVETGDSPA